MQRHEGPHPIQRLHCQRTASHVSTSLDMAFCTQTAFQHPVSIRSSGSGVLLDGTSAFPPRSGVSLPLSPLVDERQRGSRLDLKGRFCLCSLNFSGDIIVYESVLVKSKLWETAPQCGCCSTQGAELCLPSPVLHLSKLSPCGQFCLSMPNSGAAKNTTNYYCVQISA